MLTASERGVAMPSTEAAGSVAIDSNAPTRAIIEDSAGQRDADSEAFANALLRDLAPDLQPRIPLATYRLQLHAGFTFADAAAIVPYLTDLGVSDLYLSPIFRARAGSTHGYDVVAYDEINPELGGRDGFDALAATARDHGLGILLDYVPNHMGIGHGANRWWTDVLENGRGSTYAPFFDIDWDPVKPELRGKVLIPTLGDHYGIVLENGELQLHFDAEFGVFVLNYHDHPFPIAPPTYPLILHEALANLADQPADDADLLELQSVVTSLERLPGADETDPERTAEKQREQTVAKRRLADLAARAPTVRSAVETAVATINGRPGEAKSFDLLDRLLEGQVFRLAFWRVAAEEINYRRFFAINELAAIRQEEPAVFAAAHGLLLDLLADGSATGVRLDHPDGLWDPAGYARDLQRAYVVARCRRHYEEDEGGEGENGENGERRETSRNGTDAPRPPWHQIEATLIDRLAPSLYVVVEKILEHGESLPPDWPVHGTTGYEFANATTALFIDPAGRKAFDDLYARIAGGPVRLGDIVYACKHLIMRVALASEVAVLSADLDRITEQTRRFRDFTLNNLRDALREVIACFPVYRTYLVCDPTGPASFDERDRRFVEAAIREAKRRNRNLDPTTIDFVRDVLLQRHWPGTTQEMVDAQCRFGMKFQQLTGPVMAKGLEDTAFYRYNRLVALNEVGGDPSQFGLPAQAFHRQNTERARRWPHNFLASSTHDTKRGEDVRARIAVLSEIPREWRAAVNRWTRLNRRHKTRIDGVAAPDRNDEYLLYQTLVGVWPLDPGDDLGSHQSFVERIVSYMLKALREAQVNTSWTNPDTAYEEATERFVRAILDRSPANPFLADFAAFAARVAPAGAVNSLAAQLLKLTAPGVPDIYQGTELWDFSLVDPDNRRPVDYDLRQRLIGMGDETVAKSGGQSGFVADLLAHWHDGRIKLFLTARMLAHRRAVADLFAFGDYLPLDAVGPRADHVCAFARSLQAGNAATLEALVVVPRLVTALTRAGKGFLIGEAAWRTTTLSLPPDRAGAVYRNVFTDETLTVASGRDTPEVRLRLADILKTFPVALLERADDRSTPMAFPD